MARRMIVWILFLTGAGVAYSQANFPDHLKEAGLYLHQTYQVPKSISGKEIAEQWSDYSTTSISRDQAKSLEEVLNLLAYQAKSLSKTDQDFIEKYGYLAVYLSGLNPQAISSFDRTGPWQLTYPDACRYGLIVNERIDERRDFEKSTNAARLLFADLKKIHGANTEAAFVLGSAGWNRANKERIYSVEEELTGVRLSAKNIQYEEIAPIKGNLVVQRFQEEIDLAVLLASVSITESEFQRLNPTLVGTKIPTKCDVLLPVLVDVHQMANESRLLAAEKKRAQDSLMHLVKNDIPSPNSHQVVTYRVKSGDVLGKISEKYGVSVSKIKKWNNLRSDRIDINQKLTIYYPKGKSIPTPSLAKAAPPKKEEPKITKEGPGKFTIYEVQPGDTLWAISKRFDGVKPEQIMAWNGIGEDLSIGQKLKIKIQ
jgi:membrane-bound lytic murein transglycosylase D